MESGMLLAERYEVLERLGRGGMGEVWAAHDRTLQRKVAIKLLLVDESVPSELSARFERESVAAAQINHPHVVALHDRGVQGDMLFLVMELVDGNSLSTLIAETGVLMLRRALELGDQVCAALEATHAAGVVHFDIKPQNVMITAAGTAKVVDFGIAGLLQAQHLEVVRSSRLAPAATLEYAAPEQLTAERGDERSDLYALGGVLFAMLAGHAPFTGPNAWAVMAAKLSSDAPRLDRVRPGIPRALADLVARLLEREPAHRPQSASEVRRRLAEMRAALDEGGALSGETTFADVATVVPVPPSAPPAAARRVVARGPRQLPADTRLFTGRTDELATLFALVEHAHTSGEPGTVVISAIDGMAGVGKTALAIRAAHRLAPQYPDGQLFVDLHGFTEGRTPRDPGGALAALLAALGVTPGEMPTDVEARAALYRDRLYGSRTLVLLDNAAEEAQVRPLLPASDTCLVLVTSRRRLAALDDALPLSLDVLPLAEAVSLLRKAARLSEDKEDESSLERAAELCGRLPLALLIAGALLRTGGKAWNVPALIDRLTDRQPGRELSGYADQARNVQAVFDLSYRYLPKDLQHLFRRLALLSGPEIDGYAAASLLDTDPEQAGWLLHRLAEHSLLIGAAPGRYQLHDLIRAHARTLAVTQESEPERDAAQGRLLHYFAHTSQRASIAVARYPRLEPDGPAPAHAPALGDPETARAWLRAELPNLDAAFTHAHGHGLGGYTTALAAGLAEIMLTEGPFTRAVEIQKIAADTAGDQRRRAVEADALTDLGRVRQAAGDYPGAVIALTRALELSRELGRHSGEANALNDLGRVRYMTGDYAGAIDGHSRALEIYREVGHRLGEATALNDLGQMRYLTAEFSAATDALTRALGLYRTLGHRHGEATALSDVGFVQQCLGDFPAAIDSLNDSLEIYCELGHRLGQANVLTALGMIQLETDDYPSAIESLSRALEICRMLSHRHGEANALTNLGRARLGIGEVPGAVDALTRALELYRTLGDHGNEAWALNHYAAAIAASGRREHALDIYRQALALNRELNKPDDEAISLEGIAEHLMTEGDLGENITHLHQALEIYLRLGMPTDAARVQARLIATGATE